MIRPATIRDVPHMVRIINNYAERGLMIHRSPAELYERIRDYRIVQLDNGQVVGVGGLRVLWANWAEVYGLALAPEARGKGFGKQLVEALIDEARRLAVHNIFALTYERAFFEHCGFALVDRRSLPMKVWSECIRCPKHDNCDEIAVVRQLDDVPDLGSPLQSTADAVAASGSAFGSASGGAENEDYEDLPIPQVTPAVLRIDASVRSST
ncbi:MAG: N-acetyltransferase [Phycisphaerales bacterium]